MLREQVQARTIVNQLEGLKVCAFSQLISALRRVPRIESDIIIDPENETVQKLSLLFGSSVCADMMPNQTTPSQSIVLETRYPGNHDADYMIGYTDDQNNFRELAYGWFGDIVAAYNFFS